MEADRLAAADRTLVPNRFTVHLHPGDLDAFGDMTDSLASELADGALLFARARRYTLVDRPRVDLVSDATVERSDIRVIARFADPITGRGTASAAASPTRPRGGDARWTSDYRDGPTDTMVYQVPRPTAPRARLRVTDRGGGDRICEFDGSALAIGRAPDNDLVLRDGRVSRHHARLTGRRGTLVYTDLGSTNGSRVNGVSVSELVLGADDRIELGDTIIVIEAAEDPS
jgi:FHA domain/FhaA, N-terminal domain